MGQGIIARLPTLSAPHHTKELLKDIIGALWIESDCSVGGGNPDRIGEKLATIFADLLGHLAA